MPIGADAKEALRLVTAARIKQPGPWITAFCRETKLTQNDLAILIGVHPSTLSLWKQGKANIDRSHSRSLRLLLWLWRSSPELQTCRSASDWLRIETKHW